jgi:hypothetical protein
MLSRPGGGLNNLANAAPIKATQSTAAARGNPLGVELPKWPGLYREGNTLKGEILVDNIGGSADEFSEILIKMHGVNQRSLDGYTIDIKFREATFWENNFGDKSVLKVVFHDSLPGTQGASYNPNTGGLNVKTASIPSQFIIHEIGHALGLGKVVNGQQAHSTLSHSVMRKRLPPQESFWNKFFDNQEIRNLVNAYPFKK